MEKLKLGIAGSGFLGAVIANAWKNGFLPDYELVGIFGRNQEKTDTLAQQVGCSSCDTMDALLALKPNYIAEAASIKFVKEHAEQVSAAGCNLIVLSIGAFADQSFYEKVAEINRANGTKVHLASGAVGGFDVLRTVSLMGQVHAGIETHKGPRSLMNTPLFEAELETKEKQVFEGCATEAIGILPTKVNVAVASSLATAGPDHTSVQITSVPGFVGDDHKITAEVPGVKAVVDIYSQTSEIAAWSVVALLRNLVSPIMM